MFIKSGCWIGVLTRLFGSCGRLCSKYRINMERENPTNLDVLSMKNEGCRAISHPGIHTNPAGIQPHALFEGIVDVPLLYSSHCPYISLVVPLNFCILKSPWTCWFVKSTRQVQMHMVIAEAPRPRSPPFCRCSNRYFVVKSSRRFFACEVDELRWWPLVLHRCRHPADLVMFTVSCNRLIPCTQCFER